MAKDALGNVLKVGDTIIFQGMRCIIKEILENRIFGAQMTGMKHAQGLKIPDTMILEIQLEYDGEKSFNAFKVYLPSNNEGSGGQA